MVGTDSIICVHMLPLKKAMDIRCCVGKILREEDQTARWVVNDVYCKGVRKYKVFWRSRDCLALYISSVRKV